MKCWLIHTMAPFYGTDQYHGAYAEEDPTDWLYNNFFDEACQELWDMYSFYRQDEWEEEWKEMSDEDKEEFYESSYDAFMSAKYDEWCEECSMEVFEIEEEEFKDYVPGGDGDLEIIYDERNEE